MGLNLSEVLIKLWVEQGHLWLHILVQDQGEYRKHGVDSRITTHKVKKKKEMRDEERRGNKTEGYMIKYCRSLHQGYVVVKLSLHWTHETSGTHPTMRKPWYRGTEAK